MSGDDTIVAGVSIAGSDPDRPVKPNQDVWFVDYPGEGRFVVAGVLDGHGRKGHDVTADLRHRLPTEISRALLDSQFGDEETALKHAFRAAQEALLRNSKVESRVSGSTAVVALLTDDTAAVANVGDSRGVLGIKRTNPSRGKTSEAGWIWDSMALSVDSTTARDDERCRIESHGGRIDSEGNVFNGPVGIAMTRALGDSVMGAVGVTYQPEVETFAFPHDRHERFILLASDGIFGVMENEAAVSFIGRIFDSERRAKGEEAAAHAAVAGLVAEARSRWQADLPLDVRIDDATCVLILRTARSI